MCLLLLLLAVLGGLLAVAENVTSVEELGEKSPEEEDHGEVGGVHPGGDDLILPVADVDSDTEVGHLDKLDGGDAGSDKAGHLDIDDLEAVVHVHDGVDKGVGNGEHHSYIWAERGWSSREVRYDRLAQGWKGGRDRGRQGLQMKIKSDNKRNKHLRRASIPSVSRIHL